MDAAPAVPPDLAVRIGGCLALLESGRRGMTIREHLQVAHRRTGDGQQLTTYWLRNVQELRRQVSSDRERLGLGAGGLRHGGGSGVAPSSQRGEGGLEVALT
jgi:hypothetical protein